jgi:phospholipase C
MEHLVLIVQENHSFDNYFGSWCGGEPPPPTPDNPGPSPHMTCNEGWDCCDTAFTAKESWKARTLPSCVAKRMDDALNGNSNPPHTADIEWERMHRVNGEFLMDQFPCDQSAAVSVVPRETPLDFYFNVVSQNALADRYFQSMVGGSGANGMFFARAGFVFEDNRAMPNNAQGSACMGYCAYGTHCVINRPNAPINASGTILLREYQDTTIGDLLDRRGVTWSVYMEGYRSASCLGSYPWSWDPSDNPFNYYPEHRDGPNMHDFNEFAADLANGRLASVVLIRSLGYRSEHPTKPGTKAVSISDGVKFVKSILTSIDQSSYSATTLTLITWDEGGGFYDHVSPPNTLADGMPLPKASTHSPSCTTTDAIRRPASASDPECFRCISDADRQGQQFYGTRVPLIAVGPFTRKYSPGSVGGGYISHATMEHASIVKFIEWNWLGKKSGRLGTRDAHVNNLGSLLTTDLRVIGANVPEGFSD